MRKAHLAAAALALLVAACGGDTDSGVATLEDEGSNDTVASAEEVTETNDEEALLAFAACMRENGIENFQDPVVGADGDVQFGFGAGGRGGQGSGPFGGVDQETVQAAFRACSDNLEGLAFGPGSGNFDPTEIQDTLVEFSACMRQYIPDFPDPDFSNFGLGRGGGGQVGGPFGGAIDPDDPDFQAALEDCQRVFAGLPFAGRGPGGGDPGAGQGGSN